MEFLSAVVLVIGCVSIGWIAVFVENKIVKIVGIVLAIALTCIAMAVMKETTLCPNCNAEVSTKYCTECGVNMNLDFEENLPYSTCPNCNEKCDTTYCGECGTLVDSSKYK